MKITDTTALNVLCRCSDRGADQSDFHHSGVVNIQDAIHRLRSKGYRIQSTGGKYFVDTDHARTRALARRDHGRAS